MRRIAFAVALLGAGCIPDEGPLMAPGEDCLRCHGGGEARRWTVAGTVFAAPDSPPEEGVRGVSVVITDANGWTVSLRTNQAGNFYLADRVAFPLQAAVESGGRTAAMGLLVQYGGCNSCHTWPGRGRLTPPPPPTGARGPDG